MAMSMSPDLSPKLRGGSATQRPAGSVSGPASSPLSGRTVGAGSEPAAPSPGRAPGEAARAWYWCGLAAASAVVLSAAIVIWSLGHPFGIHWDESEYINDVLIDVQRLHAGLWVRLGGRVLLKSFGKPPAFRLFADPVAALVGPRIPLIRLVSLACYLATAVFVYLAGRLVGSRVAGAFAALIFCLAPEVLTASMFLSTDAPLILATAAMFYFLARIVIGPPGEAGASAVRSSIAPVDSIPPADWIGAGVAAAIGLLAKATFFLIGPPALLFCWFAAGERRRPPIRAGLIRAGLIALGLAGPWWILNLRSALGYATYARDFVRDSLGPPSPATWHRWLDSVVLCLTGPSVALVAVLVVAAVALRMVFGRRRVLGRAERLTLGLAASTGLPVVISQLSATSHLLRYLTPAVVPFAVALGVLACHTLWTRSLPGIAAVSLALAVQIGVILYPLSDPNQTALPGVLVNGVVPWRVMSRIDQWNWQPLLGIERACRLPAARIAYLGDGRELDPPAIAYPWVMAVYPTRLSAFDFPDPKWLWRYEEGPIDWRRVMAGAEASDIVVTAPGYTGDPTNREDLDNQHNGEFVERMVHDPAFQRPLYFETGRFAPLAIDVFVKKGFPCPSAGGVQSARVP